MITVKIKHLIANTDLWIVVKIFPFIFALHELEEWNVLAWHRRYQSNIPDVTDLHLRIIFVALIAAVFLLFFFVSKIKDRNISAKILLPVFAILLYNGLVHFYWTFYFQAYSPGLIFGFAVSMPVIGIIIYKMISVKLVTKWFVSLIGIIFIVMFVNIILTGNKLEPAIVNAMLLGKIISGWIGLK
jgi:hypothetical protein